MFLEVNGGYELNYVYKPSNSDEYLSVHVFLKVMQKKMRLDICSENEIELEDLKSIVDEMRKRFIRKTGIDIWNECSIYLFINKDEYYIDRDEEIRIYKLVNRG